MTTGVHGVGFVYPTSDSGHKQIVSPGYLSRLWRDGACRIPEDSWVLPLTFTSGGDGNSTRHGGTSALLMRMVPALTKMMSYR